jgi:oligopeptide/dipeptide ABC transporter ATP-binding protein
VQGLLKGIPIGRLIVSDYNSNLGRHGGIIRIFEERLVFMEANGHNGNPTLHRDQPADGGRTARFGIDKLRTMLTGMPVLSVRDLEVAFGTTKILRGVTFDLEPGQTLGVVGESGCGKSMTGFTIMGMLPVPGKILRGSITLEGRELVGLKEKDYRKVRGKDIALVMQDPFTSLNPMMRVGDQIAEALWLHRDMNRSVARVQAVELLDQVGVPAPESSSRKYPHQMSGGQRQRVVIAMAFACKPKVLIADEPTTALDVTLQAQILRLIRDLQEQEGTAVMLISHDIGAIASISSRIAVFYAGRIVETGPAAEVLQRAAMPYTRALLNALPQPGKKQLESISGQPPNLAKLPTGCSFSPRCPLCFAKCEVEPGLISVAHDHSSACWRAEEVENMDEGKMLIEEAVEHPLEGQSIPVVGVDDATT